LWSCHLQPAHITRRHNHITNTPTQHRPPPRNAIAPARVSCIPNTIRLQAIPQSHTCEAANARVSSKHYNISPTDTSPLTHPTPHILHTALTPHHRSNPSHTARTPYTLLNIKTHPASTPCTQPLTNSRCKHTHPKSSQARTNVNTNRALVPLQLPPSQLQRSAQTQQQERADCCQTCHLQPAHITRRHNHITNTHTQHRSTPPRETPLHHSAVVQTPTP
jgi:hypothetical protein